MIPRFFMRAATGLCIALALGTANWAGAEPPLISVRQAIELAQEQLDIRGLTDSVYIESVTLKSPTVMGGPKHWTVLWSRSVPVGKGMIEVGAEVDMQSKVVRLLKKV